MRAIRVLFDDGDSLTTSINGTDEEIALYYLGQRFERTETEYRQAVIVQFLDTRKYMSIFASYDDCPVAKVVDVRRDKNGTVILKFVRVDFDRVRRTLGNPDESLSAEAIDFVSPRELKYVNPRHPISLPIPISSDMQGG